MNPKLLMIPALILLQSCVSFAPAPVTTYYVLEEQALENKWEQDNQIYKVKIKDIPEYLKQPRLVMLESPHQLYFATYHQWATDLNASITQILIHDLNVVSQHINFFNSCDNCDSLIITIDTFYATEDGKVVLSGFYEWDNGQQKVVARESFLLQEPLKKEGFSGAVSAKREALRTLSASIHNKIQR